MVAGEAIPASPPWQQHTSVYSTCTYVLTGPCLPLIQWHINSDIVLLQPQATNPAQSGRSKGHWSMLYAHVQVEVSASNEVLTAGSSALLPFLSHTTMQGHRNTFYFGGANFSYQNMDIARTHFTSVGRKLLGGAIAP